MAFDLESFKAQGLPLGGSRPSLFRVFMPGLPAAIGAVELANKKLSFVCQAATLPASQVDPIEVPYFGRRVALAGERVFRPWNISVINDEDFSVRNMFESWSNLINTMETNVAQGGNQLRSYKIDSIEVWQYGKGGPAQVGVGSLDDNDISAVIRNYTFYGMFPTLVSDIRLDWSQGQAIETFDVTLAYDYWLPIGSATDNGSGYTGQEPGEGYSPF